LTSERVGISGQVIYRWKARNKWTSTVYKTFLNLTPFFKMAAKMADFMQKYVNSYNTGYIEAILQMLMAKLTFLNTAKTGLACLKQLDCFRAERNSKWRPKWRHKPEIRISQLLDEISTPFQSLPPPPFPGPLNQMP